MISLKFGLSGFFFAELGVLLGVEPDVVAWDREQTGGGGPFPEAFERDIFLNAVYLPVGVTVPPFIVPDMLPDVATRVIVDISCDYTVANNPMPIYSQSTQFPNPTVSLRADPPLDLIAIDHLPAMLPRESSEAYAGGPMIYVIETDDIGLKLAWTKARAIYEREVKRVLGVDVGSA